jgi:glycosyltransferase involved in cell wall biosynthesis
VSDLPTYSAGRGYAGRAKGGGFLFFFRLVGFLRKSHPDVVHTHLAHAKLWGRLAALAAGAGCIVHTEHANAFHDSLPKRFLARVLHRRTAVIVALSEAQRERILRHEGPEPERVVVVPNGIEIAPSSPMTPRDRARRRAVLGVPKGASMILAVGRLDAVKGYDLALEALALLPQQTHLVVVGDGALRDALLARGEALGVSARLHLLGYRDDVTDLLAA